MKKSVGILLITMLLVSITYFFMQKVYLLKPSIPIKKEQYDSLAYLGAQALKTLDVPVAAILLYKNKVIASGYNTVLKNNNIGEHAEINTLSNAIKQLGFKEFSDLNRDSLILITTYEPCLMCTGAIIENNITQVYIIKDKTTKEQMREQWKWLKYLLTRKTTNYSTLQDSLFLLHPFYPMKSK